jgi:hypothetical protein
MTLLLIAQGHIAGYCCTQGWVARCAGWPAKPAAAGLAACHQCLLKSLQPIATCAIPLCHYTV